MSHDDQRKELEAVTRAIISHYQPAHPVSLKARGWLLVWTLLPARSIAKAYRELMPELRKVEALSRPGVTA